MSDQISKCSGFTLTELVVVTALVAIMASTALPAFLKLLDSAQNRSEINDLFTFLATARTEAVRAGRIHTLCPLETTTNACGKNWNGPLYLFEDPLNERKLSGNTQVTRILPPPERGTLHVRSLSRSYFQYRPDGQIYSDLGNITWCPDSRDSGQAAQLIISRGGRIRLAADLDDDGIAEDANGDPVNCDGLAP